MPIKSILLNLLSALFILLFVYTGLSKLLDHDFFLSTLSKSPVVGNAAVVMAYALPIAEFAIAGLLLVHHRTNWGWYAAFAIMLSFTLYVGFMLATQSKLPCSCGGVLKGLTWKEHLTFNTGFTLIALIGLLLSRAKPTNGYLQLETTNAVQ